MAWATVHWDAIIGILTVVAELIVALVIYFELRANRLYQALDTIYTHKVYTGRAVIYARFHSIANEGECLMDRQEKFRTAALADSKLASCCDEQIAQFTKLGYLLRPNRLEQLIFGKWSYGPRVLIEFCPHVIVPLAVMLLGYIEQRQREKGRFYAQHFIGLAITCVKTLENNPPNSITFFGADREHDRLTIDRGDLEDTRNRFQSLWTLYKA